MDTNSARYEERRHSHTIPRFNYAVNIQEQNRRNFNSNRNSKYLHGDLSRRSHYDKDPESSSNELVPRAYNTPAFQKDHNDVYDRKSYAWTDDNDFMENSRSMPQPFISSIVYYYFEYYFSLTVAD